MKELIICLTWKGVSVMDLNKDNDSHWGEWLPAKDINFQVGDIIHLDLYGDLSDNHIFKIKSLPQGPGRYTELFIYDVDSEDWDSGHSWDMVRLTRVRFPADSRLKNVSKQHKICVCKVCKTPNEFAEPNQPDGGYICYEHRDWL